MAEIIVLPFKLIWELLAFILRFTGRLLAILLGLICVVTGGILTATGAGAVLGMPMLVVGGALLLRGLF